MSRRRRVIVLLLVAAGLVVGGTFAVPGLRWRARVVELKLSGRLPGIGWRMLIGMMEPGGRFWLKPLLDNPNPNVVLQNPYDSRKDLERVRETFRTRCSECHGADGRATAAGVPDLATGTFVRGASDWALFRTIRDGIPGTAMSPHPLPDSTIWRLVGLIRSWSRRPGDSASAPDAGIASVDLTSTRIATLSDTSSDWPTYSRTYDGQRHSGLSRIDRRNVGRLALTWVHQMPTDQPLAEVTPIVVAGVMYITEPPGTVRALDAATGAALWSYQRQLPENLSLCCGTVNRGVAVLGDRVFVGTLDAHLLALDARTGALLWDREVADYREGYSITGAPLALGDMVVTGVAGGEYGIRGFLDAYDAASGTRRWRFHTVPDSGGGTWAGDSWRHGGGPTWLTGAFDPDLNLVYWGVGNPGPEFNADSRAGDNLYTNSVIALDADSGALEWHFQFTPNDDHDWDAVQIPVLFDATVDGRRRHLMGWANRNGFYYLLDRVTGRFLGAEPFVRQTWAERIDPAGRPVERAGSSPSRNGNLIYPSVVGGTNWWSPSFDASAGLLFVPFLDQGGLYFKGEAHFDEGQMFQGSTTQQAAGRPATAGVKAIVATTGAVLWEKELETFPHFDVSRGGVLSTGGHLVFAGAGSVLHALDADTGQELWRANLGGHISAGAVTYRVDGRQMISVSSGRAIFAFGLPTR